MNEIILVAVFLVILFGSQVLISRIKKPLLYYIRISSSIVLLLLVWLLAGNGNIPVKVMMSAIALTSVCNGYLSIKRFQSLASKEIEGKQNP